MAYEEYEELIRDIVIDIYQNSIQTYSLTDIQIVFKERGFDDISIQWKMP